MFRSFIKAREGKWDNIQKNIFINKFRQKMKTVQIESIMQFEATTTEANEKGFYFKLANNWTLTIGPDIWWITDDQKRLDSYESTLSRTNFMLLYEKFKSNIKNKRRHVVRIKMSIVRTTEGKSTTMIDMFLNNSEDKRINGMVGKDFIQKDGMTTTVSYSLLSTRKKAEPRYVEDTDLGDKAHWAVIKIMIRRLCESSMI
jgi:hypothetical protein